MERPTKNVVVVGVDYSEPGAAALRSAVALAHGGTLHCIHVIPGMGGTPVMGSVPIPPSLDEEGSRLHAYVLSHVLEVTRAPDSSRFFATHVALGAPAREIARLASDLEADLVVVGTHGRTGLRRLLLGSVAAEVLRLAKCSVHVERPKDYGAEDVPAIEPPCPRCVEERSTTGELWCAQHRERHGRRHTWHEGERSAAFPSAQYPGFGSIS
jgi:nucleotide-binding universal stress UspA family protein